MKIEYEEFIIEQSQADRFDLKEKVQRANKKTKKEREVELILAYGVTLKRAIELIIYEKLKKNESVIKLNEFLEEFTKERKQILEVINV